MPVRKQKTRKAIKLDGGVDAPLGHGRLYPYPEMKVGQSFKFPGDIRNAYSSAYYWTHRLKGRKFAAAKTPKGPRVWRRA